ncbi:hypothetical protein GQ44DRAFT_734508 [Phaeosphaeriaceae sp. PMI808]|nr:hypothetical protein GQ44DRAFT_734508 [Phaeosphaeriaceae sp. PMI808]
MSSPLLLEMRIQGLLLTDLSCGVQLTARRPVLPLQRWLVIPDDSSVCKPVFIAHSVLSTIWLLRETLASDSLTADGWEKLVGAARDLADESSAAPRENLLQRRGLATPHYRLQNALPRPRHPCRQNGSVSAQSRLAQLPPHPQSVARPKTSPRKSPLRLPSPSQQQPSRRAGS